MIERLLSLAALLGSGITAGVMFAVALSVVPALRAMPPSTYVYTHRLLGKNWDPTMPVLVLSSMLVDLVLVLGITTDSTARTLFGVAAVLLLGVSVVSHFCNVPINRVVKSQDPESIPADWKDPRPLWRRWHLTRTTLAVLALAVNGTAVMLAS